MNDRLPDRIVLIGPSGSGKSEVASRLAETLGYTMFDTDAMIVERVGMPIVEFFARVGEPAFRAVESTVIVEACRESKAVIATGGGAVLADRNWVAWRPGSIILGLTAEPETLVNRILEQARQSGDAAERPLLAGDAIARMRSMLSDRGSLYAQADATIDSEGRELGAVVNRAASLIDELLANHRSPALSIGTPVERSDIFVADGVRHSLPSIVRQRWPAARRIWIVTDENVARFWLAQTMETFQRVGLEARDVVIPPGESSKSMQRLTGLCDHITASGASRRDLLLALGGGVIGDLAGFAAAICLRGLGLVQVPTSLLAMVDSSVGGKTGVNNPAGKNMIGAFYQPAVVAVDPTFLSTLPPAEYRSGIAEVIKHSVIQPTTPLGGDSLGQMLWSSEQLDPIQGVPLADVLRLNVAIKHSVVQADERETGLRMILNFGHTAGHAIEADGYRYRHGEAIALGMLVAAGIALRLDRVGPGWDERLAGLLMRAGLPTRVEGRIDAFVAAMARDKKSADGALTWILPVDGGGVEIVRDVGTDVVVESLRAIGAT